MQATRPTFTMSELLISLGLMTLLLAAVMPFLVNSLKTNMSASIQGTMLTQKATTLEWLKRDLQGTSRAHIIVTPENGRDITAISFPILRRNPDDTTSPLTETDEIAWTQTVVYHIHQVEDDEFELRRTVFCPRDPDLELAQRQEQLNSVLAAGVGGGTHNGGNSMTTTVLGHVSEYEFNIQVTEIDAYAPTVGHRVVPLGSFLLSPGDHNFKFLVTGKNPDSTGYKVGIDYVVASVTGSPMEAEYFIPPAGSVGPAPQHGAMYMYSGWSNHAQLDFPAAAPEQSVTFRFHNDTWMESNFTDETAALENAEVTFDSVSNEVVVRQIGNDTSWTAAVQTGGPPAPGTTDFQNATVRMIVGGADPVVGGNIVFAGRKGTVTFQAAGGGNVTIDEAYMMLRADGFNGDESTLTPVTFNGASGEGVAASNGGVTVTLTNGATVTSDVVDLEIDPDGDYLISFHIADDAAQSQPQTWPDATGRTHVYLLPNDSSDRVNTASWQGVDPASVESLPMLVGVESVATTFPEESSYTSQAFDTRLENAQFRDVDWRADTPEGTLPPTIKIRASNAPDMSDATSWDAAPDFLPGDSLAVLAGRYVQFRAEFHCTEPYDGTARLRDVIITWEGEGRGVDLSAAITAGPDRGKFRVMVDDVAFPAIGVRTRFAVKRELLSREFEMAFAVEANPRNH